MTAPSRRARYTAPPDAATLVLPFQEDLAVAIAEMLPQAGAVAVDGKTGTGKSFATEQVCRALGVPTFVVRLGPRPGTTKVVGNIYRAVTGHAAPRVAGEAERQLEEVLGDKPRILVIDEAQKLGRLGIDQLLHLHEHEDAQFTLVLVGMGLSRVLGEHEELEGRFSRSVVFERLRDNTLVDWLAGYHPLLAHTDRELLRRIDNRHWKGNLRRWAQTAHAAFNRLGDPSSEGMSEALASECVRSVNGRAT